MTKTFSELAYDAFCAESGVTPAWDSLTPAEQKSWQAATLAVEAYVVKVLTDRSSSELPEAGTCTVVPEKR